MTEMQVIQKATNLPIEIRESMIKLCAYVLYMKIQHKKTENKIIFISNYITRNDLHVLGSVLPK